MKLTVKEVAELSGVNPIDCGGFIRFAEAKGLAKIVEQRKSSSGKGKPSNVYQIDERLSSIIEQSALN